MASFLELTNRLSQLHLINSKNEPVLGLTAEKRQKQLKNLNACLFQSLFNQLSGPLQSHPNVMKHKKCFTVWDELAICCADARLTRHYNNIAERLDYAVQRLAKVGVFNLADIEQVLVVLVELAGSGPVISSPFIGYENLNLPLRGHSPERKLKNTSQVLLKPLMSEWMLGDSEEYCTQQHSEHLQGRLQHCSTVNGLSRNTSWCYTELKILEADPGCHLSGLFNPNANMIVNEADKDFRGPVNLFGATVQSSVSSVHTTLSLPELPSATCNPEQLLGLKLPDTIMFPVDEGIGSMSSSRASSASSFFLSPEKSLDPWRAALSYTLCKHKTWETLGQPGQKTERPYLTESGPKVFDILYDVRCQEARMVAKQPPGQVQIFQNQKQLCRAAVNVLTGLPSEVFHLEKKSLSFSSNPNVRLTGTSFESVESMIHYFRDAGTDYVRLKHITQADNMATSYHNGLVLHAFLGSIRKFLNFYEFSVQKVISGVKSSLSLLKMRSLLSKLISHLRTMALICGCDERQGTQPGDGNDPLPTGIKLISHLYQKCLECITRGEYLILLSTLRDTCGPYLMFIQDWSFHGICRDLYQEFMIEVDNEHIYKRDKYYWTHGYKLRNPDDQEKAPHFMGSITSDMFVCGKSINLLKLCCPEHFIFNVDMAIPWLTITFSSRELQETCHKTEEYSKQMAILSRQKTISRKQKEAAEEKAKEEDAIRAHLQAAQEMERLQSNIRKERRDADAKKRKLFQELKEQMEQELVRKTSAAETEKKEDKDRIQMDGERDMQTELEIKAREELVSYYQQLSEDAQKRERKALWKVRRRNLDESRREFLIKEKEKLDHEHTQMPGEDARQAREQTDRKMYQSKIMEPVNKVRDSSEHLTGMSMSKEMPYVDVSSEAKHNYHPYKVPEALNESQAKVSPSLAVESTLNLIGSQMMPWTGHEEKEIPLDIKDFFPIQRRQKGEHEEDEDEGEKETAKDTSVDDVLLKIGSVLPQQSSDTEIGSVLPQQSSDIEIGSVLPQQSSDIEIGSVLPRQSSDIEIGSVLPQQSSDVEIGSVLPRQSSDIEIGSVLPQQSSDIEIGSVLPQQSSDVEIGSVLPQQSSDIEIGSVLPQQSSDIEIGSVLPQQSSDVEIGSVLPQQSSDISSKHEKDISSEDKVSSSKDIQSFGLTQTDTSADSVISTVAIPKHVSDSCIKELIYPTPPMKVDCSKSKPDVSGPTTDALATHGPTTDALATHGPTTDALATHGPTTDALATHGPTTDVLGTHEPITDALATHGPTTDALATHGPTTDALATHGPTTDVLATHGPTTDALVTHGPTTDALATHGPTTDALATHGFTTEVMATHRSTSDVLGTHGSTSDVLGTHGSTSDGLGTRGSNVVATHGSTAHPSDSSIQNVLYSAPIDKQMKPDEQVEPFYDSSPQVVSKGLAEKDEGIDREMLNEWKEELQPISFDYTVFSKDPVVDILSATGYIASRSEVGDYGVNMLFDGNIDALDGLALPVLLERSITAPLTAQISIVNESILDFFYVELNIGNHFQNLRRYLFLEGGEFGQCLCDEMFDKLSSAEHLHELLSPISLNQVLSRAMEYSSSESDNNILSFVCNFIPKVFKPNAIDILDCLELKYKVDWPSNIVITNACVSVYNRIFLFLLKLKRTAWVLRDIHHQLERSAKMQNVSYCSEYHQLQLFRHEMQHFLSVMQSYVVNQVIHVSWEEFQENLKLNVHNLDDLRAQHAQYLDSAMHRCLLNKKAAPVMKVITDILSLVLKVRSQLMSEPWQQTRTGKYFHPNFENIKKSYAAFKDYSQFLFKVVTKLVTRGYQPHLEEFLMLLNFNDYYKDTSFMP